MDSTLYYVAGLALVIVALIVSGIGIRNPNWPSSKLAFRLGALLIAAIVVTTMTGAVLNARKEQRDRNEEKAGEGKGGAAERPPPPKGGGASTVQLSAGPGTDFAYDKKDLAAKPGEVTIDFDNEADLEHDVTMERDGKEIGGTDTVAKKKVSLTEKLEPGKYTFFCSVPGHREGGMEGTLSVK